MIFFKNVFLRVIFIFTFSHCIMFTFAQDTSRIRISLLTVTPGEELYSTFGHSALRVIDSNSVTDIVFNYGTFNFDDKDFYLKFLRGRLNYFVNAENFEDFQFANFSDNRGITEQVLNFSAAEKINIRHALIENLKEENKYYLYNFFLDNCTTRLRDIIVKNHQPVPVLSSVMPAGATFRDGLHKYQDLSDRPWTKLGMDLLLGTPADELMTPAQQAYLPDNLMYALDSVKNTTLVLSTQELYPVNVQTKRKVIFRPFVFFSLLLGLFILLSFSQKNAAKKTLMLLDSFLFFTIGLFGIIFVMMWVATDHYMMKNNYNILWAWPMHIIYAFFINKKSKKVATYSLITCIFLLLLLCSWFFLAQEMHYALIPLVLLMIYRTGKNVNLSRTKERL